MFDVIEGVRTALPLRLFSGRVIADLLSRSLLVSCRERAGAFPLLKRTKECVRDAQNDFLKARFHTYSFLA